MPTLFPSSPETFSIHTKHRKHRNAVCGGPQRSNPSISTYTSLSPCTHTQSLLLAPTHTPAILSQWQARHPCRDKKHTSGIQEPHEGAADGFCGHRLPPPSAAEVFVFMGRAGWPLHNKGVQIWTRAHIGCESAPIICTICSPAII